MKIFEYVLTGLKALVGSIITAIIMWILLIFVVVFLKGAFLWITLVALIIVNLMVVGWIYKSLWGWD